MELIGRRDGSPIHRTILHVVPNAIIRIQLWRVGRQKEQAKAIPHGFSEMGNTARLMCRMTSTIRKTIRSEP
jgi:hypothetical protein